MHILHLLKTSEGAIWALNQMKEIKSLYPDISFSVILPSGGKHFEEYKSICASVYEFNFSLGFSIFKNGRLLRKIIDVDKPDIIHSWFTQTTLYGRLFLRNYSIPRIFQVVGPLHLESPIFRLADILSANKDDYWIATSKYTLNKYKLSGVPDKKLFFNYAFIDIAKLLRDKDNIQRRDLRKEFNIPENYKIVGTASYIYPPKFYESVGVKGHEYLLKAFKKVIEQRKDVALIISGSSFGNSMSYEKKLKKMASKIDPSRIFFTGRYSHVYEVISNFDVFVYLSKSENHGGVFESLLFEIPTVSSNRGALPELVINDITGYSVSPVDILEVAEKISLLLDNDNSIMTKNGKNKVIETFNKKEIIEQGFKIYQKIINQQQSK